MKTTRTQVAPNTGGPNTGGPKTGGPGDELIEELVADCLARLSSSGIDPIDEVCDAYPEHADELRRRREGLVQMGLWETRARSSGSIGRYTVLRELGRGGMGVVYLAHEQEPLQRLVAVKVIAGAAPEALLQRFEAERQALAKLVHPNIAQVLEAGRTDDGQPYYAMEFVDGVPLTSYCDSRCLTIDARIELFEQICEAVQFAHQQGVLHRDLKPGNILVCERGGRPLVKVIDFGLAKTLDDDAPELTEQGQILGTPEYMSPEQALPTAVGVDTRSDVYALGSILYELCTGVLPFDFEGLRQRGFIELQKAVCEKEAPIASSRLEQFGDNANPIAERRGMSLHALVRNLRGELDWITQKALQKDRGERYGGVSELLADVQRYRRHEPVLASPPSTLYHVRKFVRRHRVVVGFSVAMFVTLIISVPLISVSLAHANENLRRFDRLDDLLQLQELDATSEERIWPPLPSNAAEIRNWLDAVEARTKLLPVYERELAALESEGRATDDGFTFDAPRDAGLRSQLLALIAMCKKVENDVGNVIDSRTGSAVLARANLRWAETLAKKTLDARATAWQEAIDTIKDRTRCPKYDGLEITPQLGFVPLGLNEQSGLYEFAYPMQGGEMPRRGDGRWAVDVFTCLVFVLIPGGDVSLGVSWPADEKLPYKPHSAECARSEDGTALLPVNVRLDAFFISKYEMSHGQWLVAMDGNPSHWKPDGKDILYTHPVNAVPGVQADQCAHRLGLMLPTSAQWQHAARATSPAPWWTGYARDGWYEQRENLADKSFDDHYEDRRPRPVDTATDDSYTLTAPVDALAQNPFGLHHVLGNVREWTRDPAIQFSVALPRDGDGELVAIDSDQKLETGKRWLCGGSFMSDWITARSTMRMSNVATQAAHTFGVRLAAPLTTR